MDSFVQIIFGINNSCPNFVWGTLSLNNITLLIESNKKEMKKRSN